MQRCVECKGKDIQRELSFIVNPNTIKPYNQFIYSDFIWRDKEYFCADCNKHYKENPLLVEEEEPEHRGLVGAWEDIKEEIIYG